MCVTMRTAAIAAPVRVKYFKVSLVNILFADEEVRYLCKLVSGLVDGATTAPLPSRNTGGLSSTPWLYSGLAVGSMLQSTGSVTTFAYVIMCKTM